MNNPICPCIFIKKNKKKTRFSVIDVYVDDLTLIRTLAELIRTTKHFKKEFEMKNLGNFFFILACRSSISLLEFHQLSYTKKILKRFYMDKTHFLSSLMVVHSLDVKKYSFRPCENGEELLGPKAPYLSAVGALMYLANYTRSDTSFFCQFISQVQFCSNPKTFERY